jgi:hypothetical protein
MNSGQLPRLASPRHRSITTLAVMPLAFLQCVATWPIEEMPHDDVAGVCLAAP